MARLQFSIRSILIITAAAAAAVATIAAKPSWMSCVAFQCLSWVFSLWCIVAALNARGSKRAFWVCAAAPATVAANLWFLILITPFDITTYSFSLQELLDDLEPTAAWLRWTIPILWVFSLANGLMGCFVDWLMQSRQKGSGAGSENQN